MLSLLLCNLLSSVATICTFLSPCPRHQTDVALRDPSVALCIMGNANLDDCVCVGGGKHLICIIMTLICVATCYAFRPCASRDLAIFIHAWDRAYEYL